MRETKSAVGDAVRRRRVPWRACAIVLVGCALGGAGAAVGCGGSRGDSISSGADGAAPTPQAIFGTGSSAMFQGTGGDGGDIPLSWACGGTAAGCPASCDSGSTTFSGTVYDPAGLSPLYNVAVYIPTSPLPDPLPAGPSCGCESLYPQTVAASAVTDANGRFTILNAPNGSGVPLVVQAGKWRREYTVDIASGCASSAPDRSLRLPSNASQGSLPDIAISTGGADSLECLPLRIGVDATEYVAGASSAGHMHIFSGYAGAVVRTATPQSYQGLWDSTGDLMKNDVVLLSCEGEETANVTAANQQALLDYASQGGRVFASHYHYVWLALGPFGQSPRAPWTAGPQIVVPGDNASVPGDVVTTLPNGQDFPEGQALQQWLTGVGALTGGTLPIWYARHNADVASSSPSQSWIALDPSVAAPNAGALQYMAVDMPPDRVASKSAGASSTAICT